MDAAARARELALLGIEVRGHPHPGQHYKHGWIPVNVSTPSAKQAESLAQKQAIRDLEQHIEKLRREGPPKYQRTPDLYVETELHQRVHGLPIGSRIPKRPEKLGFESLPSGHWRDPATGRLHGESAAMGWDHDVLAAENYLQQLKDPAYWKSHGAEAAAEIEALKRRARALKMRRDLELAGIEVRATQSQNTGTGGGYQPPHVPAGNSKGGQFGTTAGTSSATAGYKSILPPDSAYQSGGGGKKKSSAAPANTPQPPTTSRTMKVGDSGEDVRYAQYAMNLLGFKVAQDGQYGPETEAAVKQMQERLGVAKPNGHLSPSMLHKMQDAVRLSPCVGAGQRDLAFEAQWEARDVEDVDDDVADEDTEALIAALGEFIGDDERSFSEALHPRNPKGSVGGGRFRSIVDRVVDALSAWKNGDGPDDPLKEFNREQLLKAAKAHGHTFRRGASIEEIKAQILDDVRNGTKAAKAEAPNLPGAPKDHRRFTIQLGGKVDPAAAREVEVENKIRAAYRAAAGGRSSLVPLADVREKLGQQVVLGQIHGLDRAEVDAALVRMAKGGSAVLTPNEDRKRLTTRDRAAALRIPGYGSEDHNHWLTIEDPSPRPLPKPSSTATDVGIFGSPSSGKLSLYRESDTGKRTGRAIKSFDDMGALESWARGNGHTELADYAKAEQAKTGAPSAPAAKKAAESPASVVDRLRAAASRDEAKSALQGKTVTELHAIATEANVHVPRNASKTALQDSIIQWTVGRRLDSAAISTMGPEPGTPEYNRIRGFGSTPAPGSAARAAKVASAFHEDWRKTRLLADGSYEPRAKKTKDAAWIKKHGTDEVDIANTSYADLPEDWKAENKAAAEVVSGILDRHGGKVDLNDPKVRQQVGEEIHQAWLSRNEWAKGGELDVPFAQLPANEQAKDLDQVTVAMKALGTPAPKAVSPRGERVKVRDLKPGDKIYGYLGRYGVQADPPKADEHGLSSKRYEFTVVKRGPLGDRLILRDEHGQEKALWARGGGSLKWNVSTAQRVPDTGAPSAPAAKKAAKAAAPRESVLGGPMDTYEEPLHRLTAAQIKRVAEEMNISKPVGSPWPASKDARIRYLLTTVADNRRRNSRGYSVYDIPDVIDRLGLLSSTKAARSLALLGVTRALGHDVTPGHDELHHYWTRGEGLAKWAESPKPWTTLVAHLTKYVGPEKAKIYASRWFIEVFHFAAGSDLNRVTHGKPPRGHRVGPG